MEPIVYAVAIPAVLLSGISKGGFGSGVSFASAVIVTLVLPPAQALALMLPLLMLIDVAALRPYWRQWHGPSVRVILIGAVPGCLLGAALYRVTDPDVFRVLIGAIAVGFPVYKLAEARAWIAVRPGGFRPGLGIAVGIATGFTSFVSHAGGPPMSVFMLGQRGIDKTQYQASTVIVFWAVNILKAGLYAALGIFSWRLLGASALLAPVALVGTWLGVRAHHLVPERVFFAIAYAMLVATGLKLLWDGLA